MAIPGVSPMSGKAGTPALYAPVILGYADLMCNFSGRLAMDLPHQVCEFVIAVEGFQYEEGIVERISGLTIKSEL